jgi:diguanylate cyclase (GGDEF)-like protein
MFTKLIPSTIRARLMVLVFAASMPALIGILYSAWQERKIEIARAEAKILEITRSAITENQENRAATHQVLLSLSTIELIKNKEAESCSKLLRNMVELGNLFALIAVADAKGNVWCHSGAQPMLSANIADRVFFQRAVERKIFSSGDFQIGRISKRASQNYALPVYDSKGALDMVLVAALPLEPIISNMRQDRLPPRSVVTLLDPNFMVVLRSNQDDWVGKSIEGTAIEKWLKSGNDYTEHGVLTVTGLVTDKRIHAYSTARRSTGEMQGYVVVSVPDEIYLAPLNRALAINIAWLAMILLAVAAVAWVGSDLLILRSVHTLTGAARRISAGSYDTQLKIDPDSRGEFDLLAFAFNDMAARVQKDFKEIKNLNRTHQVLTSINTAILRIRDTHVLTEEACRIAVTQGNYSAAAIHRLNPDSGSLELLGHHGCGKELFESIKIDMKQPLHSLNGPVIRTLKTGQPNVIRDIKEDPEMPWTTRLLSINAHSIAAVPLSHHGRGSGVMTFISEDPTALPEKEVQLLSQLAADTSLGLEYIEKDARIVRLNRLYSVLTSANEAVARIKDAEPLIREICRLAVDQGHYFCAYVILASPGSEDSKIFGHSSRGAPPFEQLETEVLGELTAHDDYPSIQAKRSSHVSLEREVQRKPWSEKIKTLGITSIAAIPMSVEHKTAAVLVLWSQRQHAFDQEEVDFLVRLSTDTALGLENIRISSRLHQVSNFDALTGLPNRNLFEDRSTQSFIQGMRHKRMAALLIMRIARFHNINDSYGWAGGDAVLRAIANALSLQVRSGDTVARLGDSEFGVLLNEVTDSAAILGKTNKLISALPKTVDWGDSVIHLDITLGISVYPQDGADVKTMIRNAEFALNHIINPYSGAFAFYSPQLDREAHNRQLMEVELRQAVEKNEFHLLYQPVVRAGDRAIVGAEALLRWNSQVFGAVSPAVFIPLAEQAGLIATIGDWVFKTAAIQRIEWSKHLPADFKLAVNVSVQQLSHPDFVEKVTDLLMSTGLDPKALTLSLEITESELMTNIQNVIPMLRKLKELGLLIAIDDFGTGYSSMSYLRQLPIDTLKIDISFVQEITTDENARTVAASIIALAHSLKLDVIAEGVETEEQLAVLNDLHCDMGQGYLFSKPVPADAVVSLVKDR